MKASKQHWKLLILGIAIVTGILLAAFFFLSDNAQNSITCTINQTANNVMIIDATMDNAVICTKLNNSVLLQLSLADRVGGQWYISNSPGLRVSEGVVTMFDRDNPGFGTIEWNVTMISPGTQTLNAKCIGMGEKPISTQNLTFVVK